MSTVNEVTASGGARSRTTINPSSIVRDQSSVSHWIPILRSLKTFSVMTLLIMLIPVATVVDTQVIGHSITEYSIVEVAQELLLAFTIILFIAVSRLRSDLRAVTTIAACTFAFMLIRELDYFFDKIQHGCWAYPAAIVIAALLYFTYAERATLLQAWAKYAQTNAYHQISVGLVLVLAFSRVFGSAIIWDNILANHVGASSIVKNVIQEGLELLGYVLIACGAVDLYVQKPDVESL